MIVAVMLVIPAPHRVAVMVTVVVPALIVIVVAVVTVTMAVPLRAGPGHAGRPQGQRQRQPDHPSSASHTVPPQQGKRKAYQLDARAGRLPSPLDPAEGRSQRRWARIAWQPPRAGNMPQKRWRLPGQNPGPRPGRALGTFRRREQHQHLEFFADVEENMFEPSRDEDDAARPDELLFGPHPHFRAPAHHVVDLVLLMRLLGIGCARCQPIDPGAQRRHAQEFLVEFAGLRPRRRDGRQVVEGLHWKAPANNNSVYCEMRSCAWSRPSGLYHW